MTTMAPPLRQYFYDQNGNPLSGGKLYTYQAQSQIQALTYTDIDGLGTNTNPIVLLADGGCDIRLSPGGRYRFLLTDANDVVVFDRDNIEAPLSTAGFADSVFRQYVVSTFEPEPPTGATIASEMFRHVFSTDVAFALNFAGSRATYVDATTLNPGEIVISRVVPPSSGNPSPVPSRVGAITFNATRGGTFTSTVPASQLTFTSGQSLQLQPAAGSAFVSPLAITLRGLAALPVADGGASTAAVTVTPAGATDLVSGAGLVVTTPLTAVATGFTPTSYAWQLVSGYFLNITDPTAATTTFTTTGMLAGEVRQASVRCLVNGIGGPYLSPIYFVSLTRTV